MTRLLLALVALVPAAAAAQPARYSTGLYAEAVGPTGLYAVGVERAFAASDDGARRLSARVGVGYWTFQRTYRLGDRQPERTLVVPAGATAAFSLGRPLGVPAAFEFGVGAVFVRRSGPGFGTVGESFALPPYAEAAVRASPGRLAVRAGAVVGGESEEWGFAGPRPVFGLGFGL